MKHVRQLLHEELKPHWERLLLRLSLTAIIACGPYLFSFLKKWLVDEVLTVVPHQAEEAVSTGRSMGSALAVYAGQLGISLEVTPHNAADSLRWLGVFAAVSVGLRLFLAFLGMVSESGQNKMVQRITFSLRRKIHNHLCRLDGASFGRESIGQLTARVLDDTAAIPTHLIALVVTTAAQGVTLVIGICFLLKLGSGPMYMVVAILPVYAIICRIYLPRLKENSEQIRDRSAAFKGFILERLTHVRTIHDYGREDDEIQAFDHRLEDNQALVRTQQRLNLAFNTQRRLVSSLGAVFVLTAGFLQLRSGDMTLGEVLAFHEVATHLFVPITALVGLGAVLQNLMISAKRYFAIVDSPIQLTDPAAPADATALKGDICFEGVSMQYQEDGPFSLEDFTLRIPAGTRVCLVGPTGCGKSTVISLLSRLYNPASGSITLDGTKLDQFRIGDLRRAVGNVFHTCQIFTGTLSQNIAFGAPDTSFEEIRRVAELTGLSSWISNLPDGYDTIIGYGGIELTADQAARLSFARALISNPAVLTIDDTFSAVDENTETEILEMLRQEHGDRTWIIAASRLTFCRDVHRIAVMSRGRIIQEGSHDELIAVHGPYRRMHMLQMGKKGEAQIAPIETDVL